MDITKLIMSQLGEGGLSSLSSKIGADKNQTATALEGAVPALLGAMSSNASSSEGASGLLGALDRDHDGSILDDIAGFITNSDNGPGDGILKHVLGDNRASVENGLSQKTGLESSQISGLLKTLAPILMGYLGKQKREQPSSSLGGFDLGSIAGLLGGMAKNSDEGTGLDLNDIMSIVGGFTGGGRSANQTQSSGGGGLLGGLLGKLFKK